MVKSNIRVATEADAEALLVIYAPYVEHTAITFEYTVPTVEEFAGRIRQTLKKYPYLVAERNGEILGYVYVGPFHQREAYGWAVETTIYVQSGSKRFGIGRELYAWWASFINVVISSIDGTIWCGWRSTCGSMM